MIQYVFQTPSTFSYVLEFYENVYRHAFPKVEQAETPDIWLPLLGEQLKIILAMDDDTVIGGIIYEYFPRSNTWLSDYIAVNPSYRKQKIGQGLMNAMMADIYTQSDDFTLFAEIDKQSSPEKLNILTALGMRYLPVFYIQPALSADTVSTTELFLAVYEKTSIDVSILVEFLKEFYERLEYSKDEDLNTMIDMLHGNSLPTYELVMSSQD